MIRTINLNQLRNAEFIQFCHNCTSILSTNDPTALLVQPQYDDMILKIAEMERLFGKTTKSPLTAELEALDFRRDQALNGIVIHINSFNYHFDETLKGAATVLQSNLDVYHTGIARENYQSETALINNLVRDWQNKPELTSAIGTLNLNSWINELKTANDVFNQKFLERAHEYGNASPDTLKGKRAEMLSAYYNLRKRLNALAEIEATEIYATTIKDLNALIAQYNAMLKERLKPRGKKSQLQSQSQ